jgi:quinolinate synthase
LLFADSAPVLSAGMYAKPVPAGSRNRIVVEPQTAREARAALDRMLALPGS